MTIELSKESFMIKLINDINKFYPDSLIDNDLIRIADGIVDLTIPISQIYNEYSHGSKVYKEIFKGYLKTIKEIIEQHEYKIQYESVYPLLRHKSFGIDEDCKFFRVPLFLDIELMLVTDMGEMFRYVLLNDKCDLDRAYSTALTNISKLTDVLVKMNNELDIYCTRYCSDYSASLLLNDNMKRQILKKVGSNNYIFAIPSSSTLLVAPNYQHNIEILKSLIKENDDPNLISDKVMLHTADGSYHYVD